MSNPEVGHQTVAQTLASVVTKADKPLFQFLRIYTGSDNKSHFEEVFFTNALTDDYALFREKALEVELLAFPAGLKMSYHLTDWSDKIPMKAGQSVMMIMLRGSATLIVDNEGHEPGVAYYPWWPGTVVLAEDTKGRGHAGHVFGAEGAVVMCMLLGG